ncbi:MAG: ATP-dependent Clp protease ATP-binding subunit [Candidatus Pacebacteria bacterium]|nr:ATP-dependent Clp protease ATP-binding subunit [Candidatus Paceibacterota bacterium]
MSEAKEKKEKKINMEMIACADCRGDGFREAGASCETCSGAGVFLRVGEGSRYFWGKGLFGYSSRVRSFYSFFGRIIKSLVYLFTFTTLAYGLYFIVSNNKNFLSDFRDSIADVASDSNIMVAWFDFVYSLLLSLLDAFRVIFTEKGLGPLMFWLGMAGSMFFYFYNRSRYLSQKSIDVMSPEIIPLYDHNALPLGKPVDISLYATPETMLFVERALDFSHDFSQVPGAFHLAKALLSDAEIEKTMKRLEIDFKNFQIFLDNKIKNIPQNDFYERKGVWNETVLSPEMKRLLTLSFEESLVAGFDRIEPESLFLALFYNEDISKFFHDLKLEKSDMRGAVLWSKKWSKVRLRSSRPRKIHHNTMNKAWTARVTPELDQFSYDMTDYARSGLNGYVVNRQRETDNLMRILERSSKNNALLIGEEGCGRTTIVKGLANRMIHDEVLSTLQDKRLVVLDIGSLVSGARAGGDLELRIRKVMEDMGRSGNVILYIPNIHNMAAAGSGEGFDASKVLSPILSQNLFQIIGSTDYKNYRKYIEPRADFANNFDMIKIDELSEEDTLQVLAIQAGMIEAREGIIMTYGAIKKAVELSKRYLPDRLLPGKAIDLLSETAVEVRRRGSGSVLSDEDVMGVITEKTGIPLNNINENEAEKLLNLEENLHQRVIGQEAAIKSISSAIRRVRVGMKMQNRPVGTFLFLGPTGVGKTELAKALAEVYYGDENAMIRLDMSEYQTVGSAEKLIGSSSDMSESSGGGILTEAVKRKPFSLILLDELEKANKNVLNLFLQVFDDGRLTDNTGRTVDFTNSIIIATSNAGSKVISKLFIDDTGGNARVLEMLEPYLLQSFSPEFLNRFTDKIVFRSLTSKDLMAIARLQVGGLVKRMDKAQGVKIEVSEEGLSYLVERGYSSEYGARFLQRTIQEKLENLVAVEFLKGHIKRGDIFKVGIEELKNS